MKLIPIYFFMSLMISFLFFYLMTPEPEIIIKHPIDDENSDTRYIDNKGICYSYKRREVPCNKI